MKATQGKLRLDRTYKILDTYYAGSDSADFRVCENCGKILKQWAIVEDNEGNKFLIGLDCAAVMASLNKYTFSELAIKQAKKRLAVKARMLKWMGLHCKVAVIDSDGIWFYDNGRVEKWEARWCYRCKDTTENREKYLLKNPQIKVIEAVQVTA